MRDKSTYAVRFPRRFPHDNRVANDDFSAGAGRLGFVQATAITRKVPLKAGFDQKTVGKFRECTAVAVRAQEKRG